MIRGLLEIARDLDLLNGECFEVHASDGEVGQQQRTSITAFLRQWGYAIEGMTEGDMQARLNTPWLGVVHEDGAVLIPLDSESLRALPF